MYLEKYGFTSFFKQVVSCCELILLMRKDSFAFKNKDAWIFNHADNTSEFLYRLIVPESNDPVPM